MANAQDKRKFVYTADYSYYGIEPVPMRMGYDWKREILSFNNYDRVLEELHRSDYSAIDVETTSLESASTDMVTVNLSLLSEAGEILSYVAFYSLEYLSSHTRGNLHKFPSRYKIQLLLKEALKARYPVFHNRSFDQRVLLHQPDVPADAVTAQDDLDFLKRIREGDTAVAVATALDEYDFMNAYDTLAIFFQMDSNILSGLSLKTLGMTYLGIPMEHFDEKVGEDIMSSDPKTLLDYGSLDTHVTLALFRLAAPSFKRLSPLLFDLQPKFTTAVYGLEEARHNVDTAAASRYSAQVSEQIEEVKAKFYDSYGVINLGSNFQKSDLLLSLGYFTGEWAKPKADGGQVMSVKADLLEKLAKETGCPPAKLMIEYNKLIKLNSSYFDSLLTHVDRVGDSNVRFHILENRVPTLRLAAGKQTIGRKAYDYFIPINMMAVPKPHYVNRGMDFNPDTYEFRFYDPSDTQAGQFYVETGDDHFNFRSCFVSPEGYVFVQADFSAEELRMLAGFSGEEVWVDSFNHGKDIHDQTARSVFRLPPDAHVDKNLRKQAKVANFSLAYALPGSYFTLVSMLDFAEQDAARFEEDYRAALPTLYRWKESLYREAMAKKFCRNYYGHVRTVRRYVESGTRHWVDFAKKTAVSNAIQGSCGVITRLLMVMLWRRLYGPDRIYNKGISGQDLYDPAKCDISWFIPIHDEMSLVVRRELVPEAVVLLTSLMESLTPKGFPVRLVADPSIGQDFGHLVPVAVEDGKIKIREEARPSPQDFVQDEPSSDIYEEPVSVTEELGGFKF